MRGWVRGNACLHPEWLQNWLIYGTFVRMSQSKLRRCRFGRRLHRETGTLVWRVGHYRRSASLSGGRWKWRGEIWVRWRFYTRLHGPVESVSAKSTGGDSSLQRVNLPQIPSATRAPFPAPGSSLSHASHWLPQFWRLLPTRQ